MKPKFIQVDCNETMELDLRQAEAVKKYRPDVIILEYPCDGKDPAWDLNKFEPTKKPKKAIVNLKKGFSKKVLKIHPWAAADTIMWKNVIDLWENDHQVLIYSVDGPGELTSEWLEVWGHMYPCAKKNWVWWVQIYLRERIMANHIIGILADYQGKENPVVLIFLQSFHWKHIKYMIDNPDKEKIWDYYFGKFEDEVSREDMRQRIASLNKVLYKYWQKVADFG
ncbi:hypothetical protein KJ855_01205 [Patescibacteria group bacterium]|nr:hypothetical protein [Patescibacteria group bacterium]